MQKFSAEQGGQGAHREEEFALLGHAPASAVGAQGAAGDDAVEVRMVIQLLAPGVQDQAQAQLAAQAMTAELQQALRGAVEEQLIEPRRVEPEQGVEFGGQGENAVIVGDRRWAVTCR